MTNIDTDPEVCFEEYGIYHVEAGGFLLGLYSNDLVAESVAKSLCEENPGQHYECRLYSRISAADSFREAARIMGSIRSEAKAAALAPFDSDDNRPLPVILGWNA